MKINAIECPSCKANLEFDPNNVISFCPYCGKKLFYEFDGLSYVLTEKEKTKRAEINNKNKLEIIKIREEEKRKNETHKLKRTLILLIVCILSWVFFYLFMSYALN